MKTETLKKKLETVTALIDDVNRLERSEVGEVKRVIKFLERRRDYINGRLLLKSATPAEE